MGERDDAAVACAPDAAKRWKGPISACCSGRLPWSGLASLRLTEGATDRTGQDRSGRAGSRYHLRQKRTIQFRSMSQSTRPQPIGSASHRNNITGGTLRWHYQTSLLGVRCASSSSTSITTRHCHHEILPSSITATSARPSHLSPPSQPRLPPRRKLSRLQNITRRRHLTNFLPTLSHLIPASIGSPFDTKSAANLLNLLCPLSFASSHPSSPPPRPPAHHHHYYPFFTQNRTA
jgi:hypothetical protein